MTDAFDYERRKQQRLRKLGSQNPQCAACPENHWECLQLHHVEGQAYGSTLVILCGNCHSRASVAQFAHPTQTAGGDLELTMIARLLNGFADLLELVVEKIREVSQSIFARAQAVEEA
jgi:hypothetical protein